jgi:hypothetical protein
MILPTIQQTLALVSPTKIIPLAVLEFERIQTPRDWTTPILCLATIAIFVFWRYRREGEELKPIVRRCLALIRTSVFLVLLIIYLHPQWRTRTETTTPSRVIILVDTSASMGERDTTPVSGRNTPESRSELAARLFESSGVINALREDHELIIATFGEDVKRIALLPLNQASDPKQSFSTENWSAAFQPIEPETRLGESLAQLLESENQLPPTGIILLTDGGQNAGEDVEQAVLAAHAAGIPIHTLGIGALVPPDNLRVVELNAVPRVFPGDHLSVSGLIQREGDNDNASSTFKTVSAELWLRKIDDASDGNTVTQERLLQTLDVDVSESGVPSRVDFEITLEEEGRFILSLRAVSKNGDARPEDDVQETDIQVITSRERILLLSGGPCRDYQFLQSHLFRNPSFEVDVILQSALGTAFQDADTVLSGFPSTKEELYSYDCIVAFDPDWTQLNEPEIELLESWIATQSGGLIVTAGPVHAGDTFAGWTNNDSMTRIRNLYPVTLHDVGETNYRTPRALSEPRRLTLSREGRESGFLHLNDSAAVRQSTWNSFTGVYGFQPIEGLKLAARSLASVEDPRLEAMGEHRDYMVDQFYGLGRVLYIGGTELWRLRQEDVAHFERLYMNLIRHVSQGRLMRTSGRGTLASQQEQYMLGATAILRAQLTDSEWEPLRAASVQAEATHETSSVVTTFDLLPIQERPGVYEGRFPLRKEGTFRFELPLPDDDGSSLTPASASILTHRIRVRTPDLERENPRRNAALLAEIAERTKGNYYPDLEIALNPEHSGSVVPALTPRPRTVIRTSAPNEQWERQWPWICMVLLVGLLCTEWLIRRLMRLA